MITNVQIYRGQQPTEEQRQEIREAAKRVPVYDEDAPELSVEQMQRQEDTESTGAVPQQPLSGEFPQDMTDSKPEERKPEEK